MKAAKDNFLKVVEVENEDDALGNCVGAAFKRNKLYKENVGQYQRENLRRDLKNQLRSISHQYKDGIILEKQHEENIEALSSNLTSKYKEILHKDRFKIGTSQKALNLFLKFLWCLEKLPAEPVHCPLDRVILKNASIYEAWTKLDDIEQYRKWISKIRAKIRITSLSDWELEEWNKFSQNRMV